MQGDIVAAIIALHGSAGIDHPELGVKVRVSRSPSDPAQVLFDPVLHLPFQGRKRLVAGSTSIDYGAGDLVILAAHMPAFVEVTAATGETPYLALEIPFDRHALSALVAEMPARAAAVSDAGPVTVNAVPETVLGPVLRLLQLQSEPAAAAVLAADVRREIYYRLLDSPLGDRLRELLQAESTLARIDDVTSWMQDHFDQGVRMEDLAARAQMSVGSFHRQFRQITGSTPGAYHKAVRLHEARRQIVEQAGTLAQIASRVGFVSPSQFSRDYKRTFGTAPSHDATAFRT